MLSRWDPFTELSRLQDEVWKSWNEDRTSAMQTPVFRPVVDIVEAKDAIWLKAELPGVKLEDVHIEVEKNVLTVRGERKSEEKVEKDAFYRFERRYGSFARSFVLPDTVDGSAIDAELKDGVLAIKLPKRTAPQPRKIAVKAGGGSATGPVGTA